MKTNIALSTAVLIVLAVPAFANGHNEAAENDNRSNAATENLGKRPNGPVGTPGEGPATNNGNKANKPWEEREREEILEDPTTTFA